MNFSDTTNKDGIMQMIEQTIGYADGEVTSSTAKKAYFTHLINQWLQIAHYYAWTTDKNWHFDDSNRTDFPQATTTLVDDQRDYSLPTDLLRIRTVECLNQSGKYFTLNEMSNEDPVLFTEREQETANIPTHYRKVGMSIKLYPKPDTALLTASAGLRLTYDREMDLFTTADTTQEPGIPNALHPICYYGPVWEKASTIRELGHIAQMCERMLGQFPGLREIAETHFTKRDKNDVNRITSAKSKKKFI